MRAAALRALRTAAAVVAAVLAACGGDGPPAAAIDRVTFVDAWVDLRVAALTAGGPLADSARDRVLREHGVTEDDLLAFADAVGSDPEYMLGVWTDVEERMRALSDSAAAADSLGAPSTPPAGSGGAAAERALPGA